MPGAHSHNKQRIIPSYNITFTRTINLTWIPACLTPLVLRILLTLLSLALAVSLRGLVLGLWALTYIRPNNTFGLISTTSRHITTSTTITQEHEQIEDIDISQPQQITSITYIHQGKSKTS